MKMTPKKYAQILVSLLEEVENPKEAIHGFLAYLQRKKHFKLLNKILVAFENEWNKRKDISRVEIFAPKKFQAAADSLASDLRKKWEKKTDYKFCEDEKLIGGFKIHFNDYLLDSTLQSKLIWLQQHLLTK